MTVFDRERVSEEGSNGKNRIRKGEQNFNVLIISLTYFKEDIGSQAEKRNPRKEERMRWKE